MRLRLLVLVVVGTSVLEESASCPDAGDMSVSGMSCCEACVSRDALFVAVLERDWCPLILPVLVLDPVPALVEVPFLGLALVPAVGNVGVLGPKLGPGIGVYTALLPRTAVSVSGLVGEDWYRFGSLDCSAFASSSAALRTMHSSEFAL